MSNFSQVTVVDGFLENPDEARKTALAAEFPIVGNYPGQRTRSFANAELRQRMEKILGARITNWCEDRNDNNFNGAYQYTVASDKSWWHQDQWNTHAAVLYLTPDAPNSAGTGFFRHKKLGLEIPRTPEEETEMNNDAGNPSAWQLIDYVGNKYNRLVMFNSKRFHRSMDYFGTDRNTGRLFQTFFFDVDTSQSVERVVDLNLAPTVADMLPTQHISWVSTSKSTSLPRPNAWRSNPDSPPNIHVVVFTTNRFEYLEPMLASLHAQIDLSSNLGRVTKFIIDDYPKRRDSERMNALAKKYGFNRVIENPRNLGYSGAWEVAFQSCPRDVDYLWHQEEDFVFTSQVRVCDMISAFEQCPRRLWQLCLKRQPWWEGEEDFVNMVESGKEGTELEYPVVQMDGKQVVQLVCTQSIWYLSHPGIYPRWILDLPRTTGPQEGCLKGAVTNQQPGIVGGLWGPRVRDQEPRYDIMHIGEYNQGKRLLEGEPGYEAFSKFDPESQFSSRTAQPWFQERSSDRGDTQVFSNVISSLFESGLNVSK